ncbi:tol-pal system-associated acyl-CoA thioesterase [Legionella sp. km772]|uniref:tol-pal system-associated acyl-CoA thioesterase n=1 Tax=Legionella sp. km772 TaxID=2498111 RepID=UPI000F8D3F12|nr:tol-pal system-associated acyl-CoA thioesterase [Legionella sp. km772]RUR13189.1 tol-pal system-associated acyl-CoA thioesterase [Legionella sp. km772]
MKIKTHKNKVRVYAEDVDFMGIVYHANYLCYLERSRTEVLRAYNLLLSDLSTTEILFAISDLSIKYRAPARLDDLLTVSTEINKLKSCSFIFEQKIVNQEEQLICEAEVKVVCVNKNLKPRRLPDIIGN